MAKIERVQVSLAGDAARALSYLPGASTNKKVSEAMRLALALLAPVYDQMPPVPAREIQGAKDAIEQAAAPRGIQVQYTALAEDLPGILPPGILRDLAGGMDLAGRLALIAWILSAEEP